MRKSAVISFFAISLLAAGSAFAQDGGVDAGPAPTDAGPAPTDGGPAPTDAGPAPTDGGPAPGCNGLTLQGECNGTQVRYCNEQDDVVIEYDCATQFPDNPATCGEINAEWGFDCEIAAGATCSYQDQNGGQVIAFCQNDGACILNPGAGGSACVENAGSCTADAQGAATAPVCLGTAALFGCSGIDRFYGLECPTGSTCGSGICADVPVGGICADGIATCESGLTCGADGLCANAVVEPDPTPAAEPDGRTDPEPEPEGTTCSSAHTSNTGVPAALAFIALLGLVAVRRRR